MRKQTGVSVYSSDLLLQVMSHVKAAACLKITNASFSPTLNKAVVLLCDSRPYGSVT